MPKSTGTGYLFDVAQQGAIERRTDRPFAAAGLFVGTSAFTAAGWQGTFYPQGMRPADYLKYYSSQSQTVEVDSTFYGIPPAARVKSWYEKTPPDFVFAAKVPQLITHDKVLVDCDTEWKNFLATMDTLGEKLGPLLFQFGLFEQNAFKSAEEFLARLKPFLKQLPRDHRFAVELAHGGSKYLLMQRRGPRITL